jgi:hypothetical protein
VRSGALIAALFAIACSRQADLVDEPDVGVKPPTIIDKPDAEIPILDAGLGSDAFSACEDRPAGECKGPNDFPCEFAKWALDVARTCQRETSCFTNGWLTVHMDDSGCVDSIAMDQPNDEIVACLVEAYGGFQCPCQEEEVSYFFGIGNDGECPDAGGPSG